jgi:hypothetical protein
MAKVASFATVARQTTKAIVCYRSSTCANVFSNEFDPQAETRSDECSLVCETEPKSS